MKRPTEAFRSSRLFESGCGHVIICRYKTDGRCEAGFFLLDVFCLGMKNGGFASFLNYADFEEKLLAPLFRDEEPMRMTPAAGRKLVEGAVAYAQSLGFAPAPDFKKASRVLGGIATAECEEEFVFGKEGKPRYIQGPFESPQGCQRILQTLERRCGAGGYHYLVSAGSEPFASWDDEAADDEGEPTPRRDGVDLSALQEMARRFQEQRPQCQVRIDPADRPKLSDRLHLVAAPLLAAADDCQSQETILNLAGLAWNFVMADEATAQEMLKDILELTPDPEGVEMFLFLANRVITLFPEEDRIIFKIEADEKPAGKINLRVMSYSPSENAAMMGRERPESACA